MAEKYVEVFNEKELIAFNDELKKAIESAQDDREATMVAAFMFAFFGVIGGPLVSMTIAATAAGILSEYYDGIRDAAWDSKRDLEKLEDLLQEHDEYDLIEIELVCDKYTYTDEDGNKKKYLVPKRTTPLRLHTDGGWILA